MSKAKTIPMKRVISSNVSAVGYDEASKTLAVQFSSGGTYHYHDVPKDAHDAFLAAKSLGGHFAQHLRTKFKCTPLVGAPQPHAGSIPKTNRAVRRLPHS